MQKGSQEDAEGARHGPNACERRYPDAELFAAQDFPIAAGQVLVYFASFERQQLSSSQPPEQYHDQHEHLREATVYGLYLPAGICRIRSAYQRRKAT